MLKELLGSERVNNHLANQRACSQPGKDGRWLVCGSRNQNKRNDSLSVHQKLTAVNGQADVAVFCSQDVGGGAAVQTGRLRRHVDDLDRTGPVPWERRRRLTPYILWQVWAEGRDEPQTFSERKTLIFRTDTTHISPPADLHLEKFYFF